jgi:hypothetical protein
VRPPGFEPGTCGLRVRCSAIELEAPDTVKLATDRGRNCPRSCGHEGDRRGSNPRPPGPHPGALTKLSYGHQGAIILAHVTSTRHHRCNLMIRAPVAQLDRAGGFYPPGCGFDSCRGRQIPAEWHLLVSQRSLACTMRATRPFGSSVHQGPHGVGRVAPPTYTCDLSPTNDGGAQFASVPLSVEPPPPL